MYFSNCPIFLNLYVMQVTPSREKGRHVKIKSSHADDDDDSEVYMVDKLHGSASPFSLPVSIF